MILKLADWQFQVDKEATLERTTKNASDHCECGYCRNYYEAVSAAYPELKLFLAEFGVNIDGPSELMPFAPTLMLACYRVQGQILQWGNRELAVAGVPITVETGDENTFLLWVGEVELPWLQEEPMDEVVSPANLPEFMERMQEVWLLRHGTELIFS
ncbi:MAG: hypothetical protein IJ001_06675 [Oscillospiraceae bacterium]|nr:hypothetical protein [Oscillospiraceae bacterium]